MDAAGDILVVLYNRLMGDRIPPHPPPTPAPCSNSEEGKMHEQQNPVKEGVYYGSSNGEGLGSPSLGSKLDYVTSVGGHCCL